MRVALRRGSRLDRFLGKNPDATVHPAVLRHFSRAVVLVGHHDSATGSSYRLRTGSLKMDWKRHLVSTLRRVVAACCTAIRPLGSYKPCTSDGLRENGSEQARVWSESQERVSRIPDWYWKRRSAREVNIR